MFYLSGKGFSSILFSFVGIIRMPQVELSLLNRKSAFITFVLSLLLFQSFWNIAAAFCVHEHTSQASSVRHFGHHQATICHQDDNQNLAYKNSLNKQFNSMLGDDHHDHLPSYSSVILPIVNQELDQPIYVENKIRPQVEWKNSYKSLYLSSLSPPPEFSPL